MARIRVALAQINTVVGDLDGNVERVLAALERAEGDGCDVAVFPELAITGYPPEDLVLKPGFVADNLAALEKVAVRTGSCAAVVGFVDAGRDLYNAAAVCAEGRVRGRYHKRLLPNYAVFDEQRYFARGELPMTLFDIAGVQVGVSICEDAWSPSGPIAEQAAGGAELILNLNASPFYGQRWVERDRMLGTRAADASCTLVYVNQVGGQDELVFDGGSVVYDPEGHLLARSPQFVEDVAVVDLDVRPVFRKRQLDPRGRPYAPALPVEAISDRHRAESPPVRPPMAEPLDPDAEMYEALVVGTRDYVTKTGFTDVVVALSGGIDSTLVTTIAADALGPEHVHTVLMPSRYSSEGSVTDSEQLVANLGVHRRTIPIGPAHDAFEQMLAESFHDREVDLTEENLQSRIRGVTVMALSNKFGWLVLTTGNKSEQAVGYSTLYGDTAGGFAVIKDVFKTRVYDLCRHRNRVAGRELIPEAIITKAPSAELRPDQLDSESLPPYEVLDAVLAAYIEGDGTASELIEAGFDATVVQRIVRLVDLAEYKRRQNPIGPRVTPKAFGKDRRLPITNHYRG